MLTYIFGLLFVALVVVLSAVMLYGLFVVTKPILKILLMILFLPFAAYDAYRKKKGTYNEFEDVFIGDRSANYK